MSALRVLAYEFIEALQGPFEFGNSAEIGSANLPNSNEVGENAEECSANVLNSNYISNNHLILHTSPTGAAPASPTCASLKAVKKEVFGEERKKNGNSNGASTSAHSPPASLMTVIKLIATWNEAVAVHCPTSISVAQHSLELTAKEKGALAEFLSTLHMSDHLTKHAPDIIAFAVKHWGSIPQNGGKPKPERPDPIFFNEVLATSAINCWEKAGEPAHGLGGPTYVQSKLNETADAT